MIGLVLTVTACTSTVPTTPGADALAEVKVPDAFTALTVQPISQPTFRFPGTDGKYHLAFDVQITNAAAPASPSAVDVVDAQDPAKVLVSFPGNQPVQPGCNYGD